MRKFRIPLAVTLLSIWALLVGLDGHQDDIVDILLLVPPLALALWAMADSMSDNTKTRR